MENDQIIRKQLVKFLNDSLAHMTLNEAVTDFPLGKINEKFPNGTYTPWHLLEHIRLTQRDIVDFCQNPNYKEPQWPQDYWPKESALADPKQWKETINIIRNDLKTLTKITLDKKTNLYTPIPWGNGQTILREIILVIDHNSYHVGEFAIMRQVMNSWGNR